MHVADILPQERQDTAYLAVMIMTDIDLVTHKSQAISKERFWWQVNIVST